MVSKRDINITYVMLFDFMTTPYTAPNVPEEKVTTQFVRLRTK